MGERQRMLVTICERESLRLLGRVGCQRFQIELDSPTPLCPLAHDQRGGPYAVGEDGRELDDVLLSATDENGHVMRVWAWPEDGSPIVGLGVDLASVEDFDDSPSDQELVELLFTERERELAHELWATRPSFGFAALVAAHEAAFKATARPLRLWYRSHDEELTFEAMDFSLSSPSVVRGDARDGRAERALEAMGIGRVEVAFAELEGMVFALAVALAREDC